MDTLLNLVKTTDDADKLDSEIDLMIVNCKNKIIFQKILERSIRASTFEAIKDKLRSFGDDESMVEEFLLSVKEKIKSLKVLKLTLAFGPPQSIIDNVFNWVGLNLGEGIVLEIQHDKSILGGAVIVFEGLYKEYTVKKLLEQIFKEKREEIIKALS